MNCDFVGYTDGKSNYIDTNLAAFSKDFSGCLFVVYSVNGVRRVAHAASSARADFDCKQAFLNTLQAQHAVLHGWFRPFQVAVDLNQKLVEFARIKDYVNNNINNLTTFGVITGTGVPYSINAFKPCKMGELKGIKPNLRRAPGPMLPGNDWIVTSVDSTKPMDVGWIV